MTYAQSIQTIETNLSRESAEADIERLVVAYQRNLRATYPDAVVTIVETDQEFEVYADCQPVSPFNDNLGVWATMQNAYDCALAEVSHAS